ncbi:MAG: LytR/AlgR family response regulator transcription factor [Bacteroidales bacterium]
MNSTFAVIIEDERPAARLLKSMIEKYRPEWRLQIIPGSVQEAIDWFQENEHPDLIFLDIHLSDGNSFEFITKSRPSSIIIFTTAFDEYAIQAFKVNSIDYILKPIKQERLIEAIDKYEALFPRNRVNSDYLNNIIETITRPSQKRYRTRFLIYRSESFITLQVDDIAYFYSENRISTAVTHTAREFVVDLTLDKLSEQLDPHRFFRTNRQSIISIDSIVKVEPYFNNKLFVHIFPQSKVPITVSREKLSMFKEWLNY